MNNQGYRAVIKTRVKPKFYGHKVLISKHTPLYPHSVEREYIRAVVAYMSILKKEVIKQLPKLKKIIDETQAKTSRGDAAIRKPPSDVNQSVSQVASTLEANRQIRQLFAGISREIDRLGFDYDLRTKIGRLAKMTQKLSVQEWKKVISKTLGINIFEDYYMGQTYGDLIPRWIEDNVNLIVRIPHDTLGSMMDIVQEDMKQGRSIATMIDHIQEDYGISKRHARLIARDQTGKLYGRITQEQHQEAGVDEYIWRGVMDNRERASHVEREGKTFNWNDPPEGGHPGEDYECRCVAIPKFDFEKLDIVGSPEDEGDEEGGESDYE